MAEGPEARGTIESLASQNKSRGYRGRFALGVQEARLEPQHISEAGRQRASRPLMLNGAPGIKQGACFPAGAGTSPPAYPVFLPLWGRPPPSWLGCVCVGRPFPGLGEANSGRLLSRTLNRGPHSIVLNTQMPRQAERIERGGSLGPDLRRRQLAKPLPTTRLGAGD